MSDILPPMTGKTVDKILGKGSIALITDETLLALQPMRVNGVENCIYLLLHDSPGCADVHPGMPDRHKYDLIRELNAEGFGGHALTIPMCHRSAKDAWISASNMLRALAEAAASQAAKASDVCDIYGIKTGKAKPRHKKLKGKK